MRYLPTFTINISKHDGKYISCFWILWVTDIFSISTGDRPIWNPSISELLGADFVISSTCQVGGARGASPAREVECSGFQTFGDFSRRDDTKN